MAANTFLSLAYLVEISVVLNLAYRELKFPDLHKKIEKNVDQIMELASNTDIPRKGKDVYPELNQIEGFVRPIENHREWRISGQVMLEMFYKYFIVTGRSLRIVNWFILCNVSLLITLTAFTGTEFEIGNSIEKNIFSLMLGCAIGLLTMLIRAVLTLYPNGNFLIQLLIIPSIFFIFLYFIVQPNNAENLNWFNNLIYHESFLATVWLVLFGILIIFTVIPLIFIKMATKCELFLIGDGEVYNLLLKEEFDLIDENNVYGRINELAYSMFKRYHSLNANAIS